MIHEHGGYDGTYPDVDHEFHIKGRSVLGNALDDAITRRMLALQLMDSLLQRYAGTARELLGSAHGGACDWDGGGSPEDEVVVVVRVDVGDEWGASVGAAGEVVWHLRVRVASTKHIKGVSLGGRHGGLRGGLRAALSPGREIRAPAALLRGRPEAARVAE